MRSNRRVDTAPEIRVRSALHRAGLRFRKDYAVDTKEGRVRPDIVFTRRKVAIFVDGCFWHRCPEHRTTPKANGAFWEAKLAANVVRDRRNDAALRAAGWTVVRVWEHESAATAAERIEQALASTE
jgi:DNA mismatch endonuclease (patch repair protein)